MGLFFRGGDRVQRGRGLGGLVQIASKLFTPLKKVVQRAINSDSGKKVISAVKEQAIDSSIKVAQDIAAGKNVKTSLQEEMKNVKDNAKRKAIDFGLDILKTQQKKRAKTKNKVTQKGKKRKDIFG